MVKVNKNRRRKRYQYKNKKRINKAGSKRAKCLAVDKEWNQKRTAQKNYKRLGLAFDLNHITNETITEEKEEVAPRASSELCNKLEADANALYSQNNFELPKNQIENLRYLLDKYADDYKAMARDKKNHAQQTWKQIRAKVNTFKKIPKQFNKYLEDRKNAGLPDISPLPNNDDDSDGDL